MRIRNHDVIGYLAPTMATNNEHSIVRIPADTREILGVTIGGRITIYGRTFTIEYARRDDLDILIGQNHPQHNCVMFSGQHFIDELIDLRTADAPFPNHRVDIINGNGQTIQLVRCAPIRTDIPENKAYLPAAARRTLGVDLGQRITIEGRELTVDRARRVDIEATENEHRVPKSLMVFYYGAFGPVALGQTPVEEEQVPAEPEITPDVIREKFNEVLGDHVPLFNINIEDNDDGVDVGNEVANRYMIEVTFTPDEFLGSATSESIKDALGAALEELQGILNEGEAELRTIQEKLGTVYEQID